MPTLLQILTRNNYFNKKELKFCLASATAKKQKRGAQSSPARYHAISSCQRAE
jgi:hypothetical protein